MQQGLAVAYQTFDLMVLFFGSVGFSLTYRGTTGDYFSPY